MVVLVFEIGHKSVTWKKYLPKSHGFYQIRKAKLLIRNSIV
jgi:hypothetical protein